MAGRVALVTGGTRGIGAAISRMLKLRGYSVAANYAGNDVAASAFREETGIAVYKFDVSDFDAMGEMVRKIDTVDDPAPNVLAALDDAELKELKAIIDTLVAN